MIDILSTLPFKGVNPRVAWKEGSVNSMKEEKKANLVIYCIWQVIRVMFVLLPSLAIYKIVGPIWGYITMIFMYDVLGLILNKTKDLVERAIKETGGGFGR